MVTDAVGGDAPLDLQQEDLVDLILREAPDLLRVQKRTGPVGFSRGGGMYGKVILMDKREKASLKLFQGMELAHVKPGHPLVFHGTEPALNLGFPL